jgi:Ca2+-binding RTX toxin-like protein
MSDFFADATEHVISTNRTTSLWLSAGDMLTVTASGSITPQDDAVVANGSVTINVSGIIQARNSFGIEKGIHLYEGESYITNAFGGKVIGVQSGIYNEATLHLVNNGVLWGKKYSIETRRALEITNNGTIGGSQVIDGVLQYSDVGIIVHSSNTGAAYLNLINSGIILGGIRGANGADSVRNTGNIQGGISLGAGEDLYDGRNSGAVVGSIDLGSGKDFGYGGESGETFYCGAGNDDITAGNGNDSIEGGDDNDTLRGNEGADTLKGGAHDDVLEGGAGGDTLDGGAGTNTAWYNGHLSTAVFVDLEEGVGIGGEAQGDTLINIQKIFGSHGDDGLRGNGADNFLAGGGTNEIDGGNDSLEGGDGNDQLFGEGGDDLLYGGADNDTLTGGKGSDVLDGGTGADELNGGGGDDTYWADADDVLIEAVDGGHDTVETSHSLTLQDNFEALTGTGAVGLTLTGNAGANTIVGASGADVVDGGAGADLLTGGEGDDVLKGGLGNDRLDGGAGTHDKARFSGARSDYTVTEGENGTYVITDKRAEADGQDIVSNIELFEFSSGVLTLSQLLAPPDPGGGGTTPGGGGTTPGGGGTIPVAGQILIGTSQTNMLVGDAGNDKLYGKLGKDVLTGNGGQDIFVFDTKANTKTNRDTITDYDVAADTIWLSDSVFKKLGKGSEASPTKLKKAFFKVADKAKDKNDYLVYSKKTGVLSYDVDGSGSTKAVEIAKLAKNLKLTQDDFFVV